MMPERGPRSCEGQKSLPGVPCGSRGLGVQVKGGICGSDKTFQPPLNPLSSSDHKSSNSGWFRETLIQKWIPSIMRVDWWGFFFVWRKELGGEEAVKAGRGLWEGFVSHPCCDSSTGCSQIPNPSPRTGSTEIRMNSSTGTCWRIPSEGRKIILSWNFESQIPPWHRRGSVLVGGKDQPMKLENKE